MDFLVLVSTYPWGSGEEGGGDQGGQSFVCVFSSYRDGGRFTLNLFSAPSRVLSVRPASEAEEGRL